jgi:YVTN family beta-propeller protein
MIPAAITALLAASAQAPTQEMELPVYVGRDVCLQCHAPDHAAPPCALKPIPEHRIAYQALGKPEATEIAALSGIPDEPAQSLLCLGCHATSSDAGPRWTAETFQIEDGVQCEACHDAGSLHAGMNAGKAGQTAPDRKRLIRHADRSICQPCHIEKHSHEEVLTLGYTMPKADRLYITPVNLAITRDGSRLFVVCEHSNSLIFVDLEEGRVLDEVSVGHRPQDVAVSPDGRTLYVTNRFDASVTVVDAVSRSVLRTISVGHEPHGLLADTAGERIYVLNTAQDSVSVIDTQAQKEVKRLVGGGGPWSLALHPNGKTMYATSVRPNPARFRDPPHSEITVIDAGRGLVTARWMVDDANMLQGIDFVPGADVALFTMMRTKNLVPITRLAQGWTITNGLGVVWPDGRVDQVLLDEPNDYFPDPTDVAVSPDGRFALVAGGGSDQVAVIDVPALLATITEATDQARAETLPNHLGISPRFVLGRIPVGANPRAVVFSPTRPLAYVANALDDSIAVIETRDFRVTAKIPLGGPDVTTEIRRGQRLFHSAEGTFGRQFSCHSCHPDGHINGLSFDIEADGIGMRPVDNRTLRGIADTAPFKWEGTNPSLRRQCGARLAVFFTRLAPYTPEELDALERYMSTIERPPNPHRSPDGLTLAQRRGKAIFERTVNNAGEPMRPDQQCIFCHTGAYGTNRLTMSVGTNLWFDVPVDVDLEFLYDSEEFGDLGNFYFTDAGIPHEAFDVPHLNNIYNSGPYLHNGGAATLEEIWTRYNIIDRHGYTVDLSRRQLNELIAYLKAL